MESLYFLEQQCLKELIPSPVGQNGWFRRGKEKADFDQQPIEAANFIYLYNELFHLTKEEKYMQKAKEWMGWYYGNNVNSLSIYDKQTGGVKDGLTPDSVNENQGAESIVTYLIAYLSFSKRIS